MFDHVDRELAFAAVPLAWHEEVAGVLLKRLRAGRLTEEAFRRAERYYRGMPLETHVNSYTVQILIERAQRYNLQAIDTIYFDLAYVLGLPIATLDGGLKTAANAFRVKIFEPGV